MYTVINQLDAECLAHDWQARHSTDKRFTTLPKTNLSNIINDRFSLGWVINPDTHLDQFTKLLLADCKK